MTSYNIIAESDESTVVAKYIPEPRQAKAYQTEKELEKEFIERLQRQGYAYLPIHNEKDLLLNLRCKLEELNNYQFSDIEWTQFLNTVIIGKNAGIVEKTRMLQETDCHIQLLHCDNGTTKNIKLIDKKNIHNNKLQVINQYTANSGMHKNRYDVTILVNGFPLVHIELKRRGVAIREAFNQINRYQRESFWSASGLFQYVQIFVISNGTNTKYYSNTTRNNHIKEFAKNQAKRQSKSSNSFEFTSYWTDATNARLADLVDFTKTFFSKHTLLNILTKYCVFTAENKLLVMRPYQIVAAERIINKIKMAQNYKYYGTKKAGGFIWHTTGSGKTLTSFKTAQLATKLDGIDKVLFVVDRKDLDYQTMKEYDRFEKGAANGNSSTKILKKQLEDSNAKIIVTTIQKLSFFIKKYKEHIVYNQQIVIIFDECHRTQFGNMHKAIIDSFKNYYLFGFTGTPILTQNAIKNKYGIPITTEQVFCEQLHMYTIIDAIKDENVLPFKIDYLNTMFNDPNIEDKEVSDIERESAFLAPERIQQITKYILDNFNQKTYRNEKNYSFHATANIDRVVSSRHKAAEVKQEVQLNGFNSILCVSSIDAAIAYYNAFKREMEENPHKKLKIATIFSYAVNEEDDEGSLDGENNEDVQNLADTAKEFLEGAIQDYNAIFQTNYDTSSENFQNYYKDVSLRMKNRQLDMLIVVNMFLTGFDATTLNTLWVDKNLKYHGLLQAFSRTNRILNAVKTYGNIVCFRKLKDRTDEALAMFSDKNAKNICIMRSYKDYYRGYKDNNGLHVDGYKKLIARLQKEYPLNAEIVGEKAEKVFINLFGSILKMYNLLSTFGDFTATAKILSERDLQDYLGRYNDLYESYKRRRESSEKEDISDDIIFEIELVKQIEVNIDYILSLIDKYRDSHGEDEGLRSLIIKTVESSLELRSKKKLIENFIAGINEVDDVILKWRVFVAEEREKDLKKLIQEENLKEKETREFISNAFRDGAIKTSGTDIVNILPPLPLFGDSAKIREVTKARVIDKLLFFFEKYFSIS